MISDTWKHLAHSTIPRPGLSASIACSPSYFQLARANNKIAMSIDDPGRLNRCRSGNVRPMPDARSRVSRIARIASGLTPALVIFQTIVVNAISVEVRVARFSCKSGSHDLSLVFIVVIQITQVNDISTRWRLSAGSDCCIRNKDRN